jgi:hypothetical protein
MIKEHLSERRINLERRFFLMIVRLSANHEEEEKRYAA